MRQSINKYGVPGFTGFTPDLPVQACVIDCVSNMKLLTAIDTKDLKHPLCVIVYLLIK